jgi:multicomponent Na+:H+ antiporter subunit E
VTAFVLNVLLALAWGALTGSFAPASLLVGFILSYLLLWFTQPVAGPSVYFEKLPLAIGFLLFFSWELLKSSLRVAYDVLTPRHHMNPGVIGVPLDAASEGEVTILANLISLTPGTLSLDVSPDRRILYIHAMYIDADDFERYRAQLKQSFELRILKVLR